MIKMLVVHVGGQVQVCGTAQVDHTNRSNISITSELRHRLLNVLFLVPALLLVDQSNA